MSVKYLKFMFPGLSGVHCIFQMRGGRALEGNISYKVGDAPADVNAARLELLAELESQGLDRWAECQQVHGSVVLPEPVPTPILAQPNALPEADGMMTASPGLGLMIKTADCQPVFVTDARGKHILALHVGWRGNRNDFPQSAIRSFCEHYSLNPAGLMAVRGPSLGPARAEFVNFEKEWGRAYQKWFASGSMDLWALTRAQLEDAGLVQDRIYQLDICTAMNDQYFFSYRQDRATGRQANIIWIDVQPD